MKYKVLKPIAYGGRLEAGTIVEMSEENAKNIGSDCLEEIKEQINNPLGPGEGEQTSESATADDSKVGEDVAVKPKKKGRKKK